MEKIKQIESEIIEADERMSEEEKKGNYSKLSITGSISVNRSVKSKCVKLIMYTYSYILNIPRKVYCFRQFK